MGYTQRPVWVIAEQVNGRVLAVSLQLIGRARTLATQLGTVVETVFLTGNRDSVEIKRLSGSGTDRIYLGTSARLSIYQPEIYTEIIVRLAQARQPQIILIGSTWMGRELAPLVAAGLKTGLTAHCTDLRLNEDDILEAVVPAYGGLLSIICPLKRPQMATVPAGVFPTPNLEEIRTAEIIPVELPPVRSHRIETLEVVREAPVGIPLESADVVVAIGAGACDAEGWEIVSGLAEVLNAAVGCTRPAVDQGWSSLDAMIGQSGKIVNPKLYIGVGLSGELQHMVGIMDAKVMVAINSDKNAPVFEQVDIGIVDDCREFVPVLIEKIKDYWNSSVG